MLASVLLCKMNCKCVHLSCAIVLERKRKLVALLYVLQMHCYYKCSVALPHDVVGWSKVCDCGIS